MLLLTTLSMLFYAVTPLIAKILKFSVIGFSGLVVDFGVTSLLKEKAKVNKYVANSSGFIIAATSNYILNRIWTFQSHDSNIAFQYGKFMAISVVGLFLSNTIIWMFHGRKNHNFYLIKLIATVIVVAWNFTMNYFFTF